MSEGGLFSAIPHGKFAVAWRCQDRRRAREIPAAARSVRSGSRRGYTDRECSPGATGCRSHTAELNESRVIVDAVVSNRCTFHSISTAVRAFFGAPEGAYAVRSRAAVRNVGRKCPPAAAVSFPQFHLTPASGSLRPARDRKTTRRASAAPRRCPTFRRHLLLRHRRDLRIPPSFS